MNEVPVKQRDYKKLAIDYFRKHYRLFLVLVAFIIAIAIVSIIVFVKTDWKGYSSIISILTSIFAGLCLTISLEYYEKKKKEDFDVDFEGKLNSINTELSSINTELSRVNKEDVGVIKGHIDSINSKLGELSSIKEELPRVNKEGVGVIKGHIDSINSKLGLINDKLSILPSGIKKADLESNITSDIDKLYRESENATSVLIHGNSFIGFHKNAIVSRFNKPGSVSKWFFLNPESDYLSLVARRTKKIHTEDVKTYIIDKVSLLKEEYENSKKLGILEIYYLNNPPMQAVYVFDHTIVECKYYSSTDKGTGNHIIVYENNDNASSIGHGLAADCINLEKHDSICVFSSRYYESDQEFNEYLWKKASLRTLLSGNYTNSSALMNGYESLYFIPVSHRGEIVLFFCCRYFQEEQLFYKNKNYYENQFVKKTNELKEIEMVKPQNSEETRLFFVMGFGGTPSSPRFLKINQYIHPGIFKAIPCGKKMTLKNFGYDPDRGKWKY